MNDETSERDKSREAVQRKEKGAHERNKNDKSNEERIH